MSDDYEREERAFADALRAAADEEASRPLDPATFTASAHASRASGARWAKGLAAAAAVVLVVGGIGLVLPRLAGSGVAASTAEGGAAPAEAGNAAPMDAGSRADAPSATASAAGSGAAWVTASTAPLSERVDAAGAWFDGRFYVVGGRAPSVCTRGAACPMPANSLVDGAAYDPAADSWQQLPDAPIVVSRAAPAAVGPWLYYLGSDSRGLTAFAAYSPTTGTWQELPAPRDPGRILAAGDRVVSIGGGDDVGEQFDPAAGSWSSLPADPYHDTLERSAVWADGRLFLFSEQRGLLASSAKNPVGVARFDQAANRWTKVATIPQLGTEPVSVARRIVWSGGNGGRFRWTNPTFTVTGSVRAVDDPAGLDGLQGVVAGDRVGANGDSGGAGHLYDLDTGQWLLLTPPPRATGQGQLVVGSPEGLLVVGGSDGAGHVAASYLPLQ